MLAQNTLQIKMSFGLVTIFNYPHPLLSFNVEIQVFSALHTVPSLWPINWNMEMG